MLNTRTSLPTIVAFYAIKFLILLSPIIAIISLNIVNDFSSSMMEGKTQIEIKWMGCDLILALHTVEKSAVLQATLCTGVKSSIANVYILLYIQCDLPKLVLFVAKVSSVPESCWSYELTPTNSIRPKLIKFSSTHSISFERPGWR